jgi:hypothetical protein
MKRIFLISLLACAIGFFGCASDDDGGGGGSSQIGVPKLTGDMQGAKSLEFVEGKAAPTGYISLMSATSASNEGLQNTANMLLMFKGMGLLTDIMTCYGQAFVNGGVIPTDGTETTIEITDSDLTDNGGVDESSRTKAALTVTDGVVQSFSMYVCTKESGTQTQNIYLNYSRSGDTMSVTMRFIDPDNNGAGAGDGGILISGTGDMSGNKWVTKDFNVSFVDDANTYRYFFNLDLTATTFMIDGKTYGGASFETYAKGDYAIDGNTYYIGDGSASYVYLTNPYIESWSGTDGSDVTPASSGKHYTAVQSGTPSGTDPGNIASWGTGEDWDCQPTGGTFDQTYADDQIPGSIGLAAYQCFSNIK